MQMTKAIHTKAILLGTLLLAGCTATPVQVGENTFVSGDIVYRIIDNQITELGSLSSDSIPKSQVLNATLRNYDQYALDYVKPGAFTELIGVYRGDVLYFNLTVKGLNDLREKYRSGALNLNFIDEFGFEISSVSVSVNELIRILGANNKVVQFEYNGQSQMSREMYKAIHTYSVSSSLVAKGMYDY
jgi:hypothetical protein